jgi:selenide, water dikinase
VRKVTSVTPRKPKTDRRLLVGFDTSDDAGVYKLNADSALVQTVDFFTPLVDDPFIFGQIAASNALSDVYAMGGRPLTALSLVCFPQDGDLDILEQIMRGGLSKMSEAGCVVIGGHSVRDGEIKFGYAVTGLIHPDRVLTNAGAVEDDVLVLTKALGTGVMPFRYSNTLNGSGFSAGWGTNASFSEGQPGRFRSAFRWMAIRTSCATLLQARKHL